MEMTIEAANIIQRALFNDKGVVDCVTKKVNPEFTRVLDKSGLKFIGYKNEARGEENFWSTFAISDRNKASEAVLPFRIPSSRIEFSLSQIESEWHRASYVCPTCGGNCIDWYGGDNVFVPVSPVGIESNAEDEPHLALGQCSCGQSLCAYEFAFSTVPSPHDDDYFDFTEIEGEHIKFQAFEAKANALQPWFVSRMWFNSSESGQFMVDLHQLGPFKTDGDSNLLGDNPLVQWSDSQSNNIWKIGADVFHNLAGEAMNQLKTFAQVHFEMFGDPK